MKDVVDLFLLRLLSEYKEKKQSSSCPKLL